MSATAQPRYLNGDLIPEDQAPPAEPEATVAEPEPESPEEHDSQLDDIEKQVAHHDWLVRGTYVMLMRDGTKEEREFERTYVQKPLSFTAMLQFTGLLGEKISEAMAGPEGLTIDGVLSEGNQLIGGARNLLSQSDFAGADAFVKGLAKLATYAPSVVEDCQCIWLRVPFNERAIVKEIWSHSPEDGGLTVADGQEMLEVFLAQNYEEVEDFFVVRLRQVAEMVGRLRRRKESKNGSRRPSRPSRPTPQATAESR
jgi:hypothetical protein